MSRLVLTGIAKRFGADRILHDVSLTLEPGEVVALLGPSGSGKTTLLRILAGFETADAGEIRLGEERIDGLRPERRGFGMVFQHYALFPHLSVAGNVAFGLESLRRPKPEVRARVASALARVDLAGFEGRRIGELSGGQQQRVALARALAPEPRVLLLDEPLSNLDPALRERTRRELAARLGEIGITTILVTHEQEEAFELGRRVALLDRGRLAQVGTPDELYRAPATRFVASFVGRGAFLPARLVRAGDGWAAEGAEIPGGRVGVEPPDGAQEGIVGELFLRPEDLELGETGEASIAGRVVRTRFAGPVSWVTIATATGVELEVLAPGPPPVADAPAAVRLRSAARPRFFASSGRA